MGSHPFVLASRLLAIHLPGPKRPQECSLGLKPYEGEQKLKRAKTALQKYKKGSH